MATNVYFNTGTRTEQTLYEDLIIEQLKVFGQEAYYIPRTIVNLDKLFGEDPLSEFNDSYMVEMYFENAEGYEGDKELVSKFGLEIRNEASFVVAKRRWRQLVSHDQNLINSDRPNEGDLVYVPHIKAVFEISFVDHDEPFYQLANLPVYKLKCHLFEYSHEKIDTGVTEIDLIQDEHSLDMREHEMLTEQQGFFTERLTFEDGSLILGEYEEIFGDTLYISAEDQYHEGSISLETGDNHKIILESYDIEVIDKKAQNNLFEILDDDVLDFSESNPFGDAGTQNKY